MTIIFIITTIINNSDSDGHHDSNGYRDDNNRW